MELPDYGDKVSLIPGGLPQMLDFEIPYEDVKDITGFFWEEERERDKDGKDRTRLHPVGKNPQDQNSPWYELLCSHEHEYEPGIFPYEPMTSNERPYSVSAKKPEALEPWFNQWIPVPFLRENQGVPHADNSPTYMQGPSNWSRARVTLKGSGDDMKLRVVLAFDMKIDEPDASDETGRETGVGAYALYPKDLEGPAFSLAEKPEDNSWYLNRNWVDEWLRSIWNDYLKRKPGSLRLQDGVASYMLRGRNGMQGSRVTPSCYLASYLVFLKVLKRAIHGIQVTISNCEKVINVDLVLDVGNSRTTGFLVENDPDRDTLTLEASYPLQLRDMDAPENIYSEPFPTRIEFCNPEFGTESYGLHSGRKSIPFRWVSCVRTGREAERLASLSVSTIGTTGMSSPKRYLWDDKLWDTTWRFNNKGLSHEENLISGLLAENVNDWGRPLCCPYKAWEKKQNDQVQYSSFYCTYTRSSMMMFLFVEILQQALMTINSPGQRKRRYRPDVPRRLRKVIFTVPSAMPVAEQRIYRQWAQRAIGALWHSLNWPIKHPEAIDCTATKPTGNTFDYQVEPEIFCRWDEATCTQLVYLYNEISENYQGDAYQFFEQKGKPRKALGDRPCIRIASIDIGGGTTDLSVTSFVLQSEKNETTRIGPKQEFHDGFNIAGDNIVKNVIRQVVFKGLSEALTKRGFANTEKTIRQLFGRSTTNANIADQILRTQCVRQVMIPLAYAVLSTYEKRDPMAESDMFTLNVDNVFIDKNSTLDPADLPFKQAPRPLKKTLAYLESQFPGLDLTGLTLEIKCDEVRTAITDTIGGILRDMCEIVRTYDTDILLLTGRPSCWDAVVQTIFQSYPTTPDRIIPMKSYKVGSWYPFTDGFGNITDPKTTVVVGSILCLAAQNSIQSFSFDSNNLRLTSTARYIGELSKDGSLSKEKVWFTPDLEQSDRQDLEHTVTFSAPILIGYRQLPIERWTATQVYEMRFRDGQAEMEARGKQPYKVKVNLQVAEINDDYDRSDAEAGTRTEGEFTVLEIENAQGSSVPVDDIVIRMKTLKPEEQDYSWLDSGIIYN